VRIVLKKFSFIAYSDKVILRCCLSRTPIL